MGNYDHCKTPRTISGACQFFCDVTVAFLLSHFGYNNGQIKKKRKILNRNLAIVKKEKHRSVEMNGVSLKLRPEIIVIWTSVVFEGTVLEKNG